MNDGWRMVWTISLLVAVIATGIFAVMMNKKSVDAPLSLDEQRLIIRLAHRQLEAVLAGKGEIEVDQAELSPALMREAACFVTLTKAGALRGCIIDNFIPHEPLYKNVLRNVVLAATKDPRFLPVSLDELAAIRIEISVLDAPRPLFFDGPDDLLAKLNPGKDGVILKTRYGLSTYLPQVWEALPDPAVFLSNLCEKQGAPGDCWRSDPSVQVEIYHVFHFTEGGSSD
jgi:AmmeMemoRadiSam system protein A